MAKRDARGSVRHDAHRPRRSTDVRRVTVWALIASFVITAGLAGLAGSLVPSDDQVVVLPDDASLADVLADAFPGATVAGAVSSPVVALPAAVRANTDAAIRSAPAFSATSDVDDCLPREPGDVDPLVCCPFGSGDNDCDGLGNDEETQIYDEFFELQPYPFSARCDFTGGANENPDIDCDGLTDGWEHRVTGTRIFDADTDGGGVDDGLEVLRYGTDPLDPDDDPVDTDRDGLPDDLEDELGTDPEVPDSDGDGLDDWSELRVHGTDPTRADTDADGLSDGDEVNVHFTDPLDPDTDGGGELDGDEVAAGRDPWWPEDDVADDYGVVVTALRPGAGTGTVELAWATTPPGTRTVELLRSGASVAQVDVTVVPETVIADPGAPVDEIVTYQLRAISDDATTSLGLVDVRVPVIDLACTIAFTGAAGLADGFGFDWSEPANWVPVLGSEAEIPPARAPAEGDHACLQLRDDVLVSAATEVPKLGALTIDTVAVDLSSDVAADALRIDGGALFVGSLTVDTLDVDDATLQSVGPAEVTDTAVLRSRSSLGVERLTVGGVLELAGTGTIVEGDVEANGRTEPAGAGFVDLAIAGELRLASTSELRLRVGAAGNDFVRADALALAGSLTVDAAVPLGADTDVLLVDVASPPTGAFTSVTAPEGAEVVVSDAGVRVVGVTSPSECVDVPDLLEQPVTGCWIPAPGRPGSYLTDSDLSAGEPAAIGALVLRPTPGTEVVVDPAAGVVTTIDQSTREQGGAVELALTVATSRPSGFRAVPAQAIPEPAELIELGLRTLNEWLVESGLTITPPDVLGLPPFDLSTIQLGSLGNGASGWLAQLGVRLPAVLGGTPATLDLAAPVNGVSPADLELGNLESTVGELFAMVGLDLSWVGDQVWQVATDVTEAIGVDGSIDLATSGGSGQLTLRGVSVGDLFAIDDVTLTRQVEPGSETWSYVGDGVQRLRELSVTFAGDQLVAGRIELGDVTGENDRIPSALVAGGWLDIAGVAIDFDGDTGNWRLNGLLREPEASVTGGLQLVDGDVLGGQLALVAEIGTLATLDLNVGYDGAGTWTVDVSLIGDGFDTRSGSGVLEFFDGELVAGEIGLTALPIGELATIDDFTLTFDRDDGEWAIDGEVTSGDTTTVVDGFARFVAGVLVEAHLEIAGLDLGPSTIELLVLDLDRSAPDAPVRTETFTATGWVTGVATGTSMPQQPISGTLSLRDGRITAMSLEIPNLAIGNLAHLQDTTFSYVYDADEETATVNGAGTLRTGDGTTESTATLDLVLADGVVQSADLTADHLSFGGMVTVTDLALSYERNADRAECAGVVASDLGARLWTVSGTVPSDGATATAAGCLVMVDRAVLAGQLELGDVVVGELFRVVDLTMTFADTETEGVELVSGDGRPAGTVAVAATTFDVTGTFEAAGSTTAVAGSLRIRDGDLEAFSLDLDDVPIMTLLSLRDLTLAYDRGTPWDGSADATFSLGGTVVHGGGTSTLAGSVTFDREAERVTSLMLSADDVPFGPVVLDSFDLAYDGTRGSSWEIGGAIVLADGTPFSLTGELTLVDGRVTALVLDVPRVPLGDLVMLRDVRFTYDREGDGTEIWSGTGGVSLPGSGTASAAIGLEFGPDRQLRAGAVEVDDVRWGGLFAISDFGLFGEPTDDGFVWTVRGDLAVADGQPTSIDGELVLDDGRVERGELGLAGLRIAGLVEITRFDLTIAPGDRIWSADVELGSGATASGAMEWSLGGLTAARLQLGSVDVGQLFTLDELLIDFEAGATWAVGATITDEDGTSTLGGQLDFDGGQVVGGALELANVQIGPLDLASLDLIVSDVADLDGVDVPLAGVCDTTEPSGLTGTRWAAQAVVRTGDGDTTTIAGRLRLDDGSITDAVLCGSDVQIADIVVLEELRVGYSQPDPDTDRWFGEVRVSDPDAPGQPFTGEVDFTIAERRLQTFELTVGGLRLGELLSLENLALVYDRGDDAQFWSLDASLRRPGADQGSIEGSLAIDDGVIVGGTLFVEDLPFGDAFTLVDLEIEYYGRRPLSQPFDSSLPLGLVGLTESNGCGLPPSGSNVPTGPPTTTGPESYYRVAAAVRSNDTEFAVGGALSFAHGRLTTLDITLDCVPLGDWQMLQDVRLLYATGDQFVLAGRLEDDDPTTSNPRFTGVANFDDGRLVGGSLRLGGIPLGAAALEQFELTLGQQPNGTSVWGAALQVRTGDGQVLGGGGSITLDDGKVVGGSLSIPELPIADLIVIENITLSFDGSQPNRSLLAGSAGIRTNGGGGGSMVISLRFEDGKLTAGSFSAGAVNLFDVIPVGSFSLSFDNATKSWSASLSIGSDGPGQNVFGTFGGGPSIQAGVEIRRGKLISGIIGFDGDGDGEVDAPAANGDAPASGSGRFAGLPLRAFYLRYCGDASSAPFCGPGLEDTWDGRITIELETQAAPSIDAQLRIKDGRFASAAIDVGFPAPGIPVFSGVFLNSLEASLELDPRLRFCGGLGLTVGGGALTVARLDASIEFSEEPLPYDPPPPELCELTPPGEVPDDWEPEYLRFLIQGVAELFPGNPLDIDITGQAYLELQTRGYLGAGAQFNVEFIENTLGVSGFAEGSLFNANRVPATNPKTGQPLTGAVVQLKGGVSAQLLGADVAQAAFVVNTVGAAACAGINFGIFGEARVGAGIYWSGGQRLTCDLGRYLIVVPGTVGFNQSQPQGFRSVERAAAPLPEQTAGGVVVGEFFVPSGEDLLGVDVLGIGGAPDVTLVAPDGTRYRDDVDDPSTGTLISTSDEQKFFVIAAPQPGIWQIERMPGSVELGEITTYLQLPAAQVTGTVVDLGDGSFALDAEILDIEGQEVMFVEREPGQAVLGGVGLWTSPDGATGTSEQRFEFVPGGSESGGPREVVALVLQDGFQRDEIVVATYDAPAATPAGPPLDVQVVETDGGATVTWEPPVSDGGREILGYRITSWTGFPVTVEPDARSATITVPMLTEGVEVPVAVEAFTGVGWGEPGVATFVSTQQTGPMFSIEALDPGDGDGGTGPSDPSTTTTVPTTTVPSAPTTTTVPSDGPTTSVPATTSAPSTTVQPSGGLPLTGGSPWQVVPVAVLVLAAGLVALMVSLRRGRGSAV